MSSGFERALGYLNKLPRVALENLKPLPRTRKKQKRKPRGQHGGRKCGRGNKGQGQRNTLNRIGFEGGATPFYLLIPKEPYYYGHHVRRQYPPLTLLQLQRMIDMGQLDTSQPVDLTALCNTRVPRILPERNHYGINLTDEGLDRFVARVNIEVQWTSEEVIAAVEGNGGTITTRFYDLSCVRAMIDPKAFLQKGMPIPRCKLPPQDAIDYYSDPKSRGYLADPDQIQEDRLVLAQKYGYTLPELDKDPEFEMLTRKKDPRQIWFGLEPGWVVNLTDKNILKPKDEQLKEYFHS